MGATQPDSLIIGGGPAGCALAVLLARRGLDVVLVDHDRAHHSGPYETVLSSATAGWRRLGLLDLVQAGALPDPLRHGAIWGSSQIVWRDDEQPGLLLPRPRFDRALRHAAAQAGVDVRCPARALPNAHGSYRLVAHGDGGERVEPRTVAVATGRSPSIAGLPRALVSGPATTALTLIGEPTSQDRGTAMVEATADGWLWTHAPRLGAASATAFVDTEQLRQVGARELLRRMVGGAIGSAGRLSGGKIAFANDATPRRRAVLESGPLVLGDAAATIDPLASQGVEKAIAAAEHAAVVIATAVEQPDWWPRLCNLHGRWELGLHEAHQRVARDYYRRELRFLDEPFWRSRGAQPIDAPQKPLPGPMALADHVARARVLARSGDTIAEVDGAIDRRTGEEVARIGHVPLAPLLRLFAVPRDIGSAVAAAGQEASLFVLSPRAVQDAITALWARGWLAASNAAGSR